MAIALQRNEAVDRPAVVYARISKDEAGDALGVERQIKLCRDLARSKGLHVGEVLVDNDVSAFAHRKRPEFERLVGMLRDGEISAVVVYHSDRLYRRAADLERLVEVVEHGNASVHTVAAGLVDLSTASGRMIARMLGAAAQHESERLGERLRMKMDELAASGKPPAGRPPYGYGPGYVVDKVEARHLQRMAKRVLEGASLSTVARELDAAGVKPRKAAQWNSTSVRTALLNPAVVALRIHRREIAGPATWQPVLDRDTWEKVGAVLADPSRKHKRPASKYLLAGMVFTEAGDKMNGRLDRGEGVGQANIRNRRTYATQYDSKNRRGPQQPQAVDADKLEALIVDAALSAFDEAVFVTDSETSVAPEVEAIESELNELAALRGRDEITMGEWMAARKPLVERLAVAKQAASQTRRTPTKLAALLRKGGALRKAWPSMDFETRREVMQLVIQRVVLRPATRARHTPIAERVADIIWRV